MQRQYQPGMQCIYDDTHSFFQARVALARARDNADLQLVNELLEDHKNFPKGYLVGPPILESNRIDPHPGLLQGIARWHCNCDTCIQGVRGPSIQEPSE